MFYIANYLHNPNIYPPLFVGLLIGALGVAVIVREKRSSASLMFGLLTTLVMMWLLSYVGIFSSANRSIALQWVKLEIMIVVFIPSALYVFSLILVSRFQAHRFLAWASVVLSFVFCLAVASGNRFVEGVHEYRWGYYAKFGALSIPFLLFFFSMLFLSLGLFFAEQRKAASLRQKRLQAMIVAYSVGYLGSIDYLPTYGISAYPAGYLAILGFVLISAWAIWRYQLVDITPQFAAQKILDTMDDALLVLDAEGIVRAVNRSACNLFGISESRFVGRLIREADADFFSDKTRERLVQTGAVADYEIEFKNAPAQDARILSVSASVMRDVTGQPVAFVLIARDITDFKRTEGELLKGLELARTTAEREQLELFAFAASHDLREPLQKIISFGDLLKMTADKLDGKAKDYIERMQKAAFRMSELIDAILRFSRATTREEHLERINLGDVVRDVLGDLEAKIAAASAKIECNGLPTVEIDRMQIHEVFQNLLSNSLKFAKKGEPARIRVKSGPVKDGFVEIRIEDNGVGFDPKYSERIFKPFERLHSRSEYEGYGMGLAICQKILHRHHGRIAVESGPGKGTTFILWLPASQPLSEKAG